MSLPKLCWAKSSGKLSVALGATNGEFEAIANREIDAGRGIRSILDCWQAEIPYASFEEWTVAVFALGVFDGSVNGQNA